VSVFTLASLMARSRLGCACTTSATCGVKIRVIAGALPVASSTTRSSATS